MPISNGTTTEPGWELVIGYPDHSTFIVVVEKDLVIGGEFLRNEDTCEEIMVASTIGRYFPIGCSVYYVRLDGQKIIESRKLRDIAH